ncbi:MmgE/PrpD family protein [Pararobbsia silviterrae]|uniref:MmgE/PrpD N-terminal domain-containing protein n=1 Tax=Pararobbsia silviterrae TaxID=1792498 RepID=A0A494Y4P1_9BURK|nr:MmgE/PrpD family protein [Pararobbsia silviterrae]RKP57689.1 hypothetical protein D7S86_07055 [Pararobbsia silviterrae]
MHSPAAHSEVSDALTALASSTPDAAALDAARAAIARARRDLIAAPGTRADTNVIANADAPLRALRDSDAAPGDAGDARLNAWELGTTLARAGQAGVETAVIGAALAIGVRLAASDDAIAAAVAVGTLAATRLLTAVDDAAFRARWNVAASLGIVGATLAVSRLLGLDAPRMRHALGIAATQAAGLARNNDEAMGALETGKAAADAIEASLLAKHGFTSAVASIDGRRGLAALMAYRFDATAITAHPDKEIAS